MPWYNFCDSQIRLAYLRWYVMLQRIRPSVVVKFISENNMEPAIVPNSGEKQDVASSIGAAGTQASIE